MKHLDASAALLLCDGAGPVSDREHVAGCRRCQNLVAEYAWLLEGLRIPRPEVPGRLLRWARAYASLTALQEPRTSILDFLAGSACSVATVRGGEPATVINHTTLWGDDHFYIDLRWSASQSDQVRLYGQVVPLDHDDGEPWRITALSATGECFQATTTADGHFELEVPESKRGLTVIAETADQRLVIQRVDPRDLADEVE